jgi:hypothetical protein
MVSLIADLTQDWPRLDERIEGVSSEIEALAEQDESCQRLMSVPGLFRPRPRFERPAPSSTCPAQSPRWRWFSKNILAVTGLTREGGDFVALGLPGMTSASIARCVKSRRVVCAARRGASNHNTSTR